jgi:hypothetical protein
MVTFAGRPGVSPVLAALIALEHVRPDDRILDVGCGPRFSACWPCWGEKARTSSVAVLRRRPQYRSVAARAAVAGGHASRAGPPRGIGRLPNAAS